MGSSKTTNQNNDFDQFNQNDYDAKFYSCSGSLETSVQHPFVAFTTCYCPLCDLNIELAKAFVELAQAEQDLENKSDEFYDLVAKARKLAPEILL